MRICEVKEFVRKEEVLKTIKCDTCGKDILKLDVDHFYTVTTSHDLHGNDSVESFEYFDFCSYDCLLKDMNEYFSNAEDTQKYEIEREGHNNGYF